MVILSSKKYRIKKVVAAILGCLLLAACGNESEVEKTVLATLKDPDSAKFGKFTQVSESLACMTVNAKNSMGGYSGDRQAFLEKIKGKWEVLTTEEVSHDMCIQTWAQLRAQAQVPSTALDRTMDGFSNR